MPVVIQRHVTTERIPFNAREPIIDGTECIDVEDHRLDATFDVRVNDGVVNTIAVAVEIATHDDVNFVDPWFAKRNIEMAMRCGTQPNIVVAA